MYATAAFTLLGRKKAIAFEFEKLQSLPKRTLKKIAAFFRQQVLFSSYFSVNEITPSQSSAGGLLTKC